MSSPSVVRLARGGPRGVAGPRVFGTSTTAVNLVCVRALPCRVTQMFLVGVATSTRRPSARIVGMMTVLVRMSELFACNPVVKVAEYAWCRRGTVSSGYGWAYYPLAESWSER